MFGLISHYQLQSDLCRSLSVWRKGRSQDIASTSSIAYQLLLKGVCNTAYWTVRRQTNSRSIKLQTGQLDDGEFFKSRKDCALNVNLLTVESVQLCNLPQITFIAIISVNF